MVETRKNWIEVLDLRQEELNQFANTDAITRAHLEFYTQLSNKIGDKKQNLNQCESKEDAVEIVEKTYDAMADQYIKQFLKIPEPEGEEGHWGRARLKSVFGQDSKVVKEKMIQSVAKGKQVDQAELTKTVNEMAGNLEKENIDGILEDLTETDKNDFVADLSTRAGLNLDPSKFNTVHEAAVTYLKIGQILDNAEKVKKALGKYMA